MAASISNNVTRDSKGQIEKFALAIYIVYIKLTTKLISNCPKTPFFDFKILEEAILCYINSNGIVKYRIPERKEIIMLSSIENGKNVTISEKLENLKIFDE